MNGKINERMKNVNFSFKNIEENSDTQTILNHFVTWIINSRKKIVKVLKCLELEVDNVSFFENIKKDIAVIVWENQSKILYKPFPYTSTKQIPDIKENNKEQPINEMGNISRIAGLYRIIRE